VCYKIGNGVNHTAITNAINIWQEQSPLEFLQCPAVDGEGECCEPCGEYINFQTGTGCFSSIGRSQGTCRSGGQALVLGPGCTEGNAIHEIGHAIGLVHEHVRPDRERFVKVFFENIIPDNIEDYHTNPEYVALKDIDGVPLQYGKIFLFSSVLMEIVLMNYIQTINP